MRTFFKAKVGWLLMIVLPLLVIGWLGVRTVTAEYQTLTLQRQQLERQQFAVLDTQLIAGINQWVDGLQALTKNLKKDLPTIRYQLLIHPALDGVLLLDENGEQLYPPDVNQVMFQEQELLRGISSARVLADRPLDHGGGRKWYAQLSSKSFRLVCDYFPDQSVQCLRLQNAMFLEQVQQLVKQWLKQQTASLGLQILDDAGRIVLKTRESEVWQSLPLSLPLAGWQLRYLPANAVTTRMPLLPLISMLLPWALVLMVTVGFLYYQQSLREREFTRKAYFLNQVAHELRTPLTSIRLYTELAEMREPADAKLSQYLQVILTECKRMSELAEHYLHYQRSTTTQVHEYTLESMPNLLEDIVTQWQSCPNFSAYPISISGDSYRPLWVHRCSVEQILTNLLTNTYKYACSAQAVQVRHSYHKPYWELQVRDFGCGIPQAWQGKIFEPFVRIPKANGSSGSGLGLSICANLAAQHGGGIRLVETVTDGACFVVRLRCQEEA